MSLRTSRSGGTNLRTRCMVKMNCALMVPDVLAARAARTDRLRADDGPGTARTVDSVRWNRLQRLAAPSCWRLAGRCLLAGAFLAGAFLAGAFLPAPSWPVPSWPAPSWLVPSWLVPYGLAPSWLEPSWLVPYLPAPSWPVPSCRSLLGRCLLGWSLTGRCLLAGLLGSGCLLGRCFLRCLLRCHCCLLGRLHGEQWLCWCGPVVNPDPEAASEEVDEPAPSVSKPGSARSMPLRGASNPCTIKGRTSPSASTSRALRGAGSPIDLSGT